MRYFGGKGSIANEICMMVNQWMDSGQEFIEPFVGGAWIVRDIRTKRRYAADTNPYLIAMYQALQEGWVPPTHFNKSEYEALKANKEEADPALVGFIGAFCSFGGMWFAGLATDAQKVNYVKAAARGCVRLAPYIRDVEFRCCSYDEWKPDGAFIYCDPPYAGVGQEYFGLAKKASFDSDKFWETMRKWSENNVVVISEYKAPDDFKIVAEYRVYCHLNRSSKNGYAASNPKKNRSEKVFSLNKKYDPFEGIF